MQVDPAPIRYRVIQWCFITVLAGFAGLSPAFAAQVQVVFSGDRQPASVAATTRENLVYIGVEDLARVLGVEVQQNREADRLYVGSGSSRAKFTAWNPVVTIDEIPRNLPAATIVRGGVLLAPAEDVTQILDPYVAGNLVWDAASGVIRASLAEFNVHPGSVEVRENGTLVTFRIPQNLPVEEEMSPPRWLHLTILGGSIDPRAFRQMGAGGALLQMVAYQYQNVARISLRLAPGHTYETRRIGEDYYMLTIRRITPLPAPVAGQGDVIQVERNRWTFDTIIVDAGHGGRDPGCVGWNDIYEKDIVLRIAERLSERLRNDLGVNVIMTRDSDEFVSLRQRGRLALERNGKLFVSIHCNALQQTWVSGVQTYFLSDAQTDEAREVARRENASLRFEIEGVEGADSAGCCDWEEDVLLGMGANYNLQESQALARTVQDEMVRSLGSRDLGVQQANLYVMRGTLAAMPSVLVEVGYLTNPAEARKLRQRSYQRRIGDAIFRAIREFKTARESDL